MGKYLHKFWGAIKSVFYYKNFWEVWLSYLGLYDKDYLFVSLFNGLRCKIRSRKVAVGDTYIVNEIWLYGAHKALRKFIRKASVGIDVGAHIGVFSLWAVSQNPSLKIYAYEPAPGNFQLLKENILLNNLSGKIIPFAAAVVGDARKSRDLYLTANEAGLCTINPTYLGIIKNIKGYRLEGKVISSLKVDSLTLEDIFNTNKIDYCDFLKMDCEGAEYEILLNAPIQILKRIGIISVEYHAGRDVRELVEFLKENNFKVSFPHRRLDVLAAENRVR